MPNHQSTLRIHAFLMATFGALAGGSGAYAFEPVFYTTSSVLANGQWAKIEVSETGMQFISDATLRNLGFSDPEKVNVFGYGGGVIPENLDSPDDLPLVGSIRINGGIAFFGKSSVGWQYNNEGTTVYSHLSHPYSDNSYYFISDCLEQRKSPAMGASGGSVSGNAITTFTERLLHEEDVYMPMFSGRLMLGEDFTTASARSFRFQLPGNTGDALVTTAFASKTSGGTASIVISANGTQLPSTSDDQMPYSDTKLIVPIKTIKNVEDPGTSLDLNIKFNGVGNVSAAGLDYIEVEYQRNIDMTNGEIYFYLSPAETSQVKINGASASTIVWDVTNHTEPIEMETRLDGAVITFTAESGPHEYVAFEPTRLTRAVTPGSTVSNQDLHAMEAPDMLVITPGEYLAAAQRLIDLHRQYDGLELLAVTPEEIYNEFSSGKPDVSAFRKFLKMWYDRAQATDGQYPKYCLILSRPTYDNKMITPIVKNAGYPRVPIYQSPSGETETTSYSTDDYIGMLEDPGDVFNIGTSEIQVAVGRMPFTDMNDANTVLDKLENYLFNPDLGAWRNNIMVIADDQDSGVHLDQAEAVVEGMKSSPRGNHFLYEKLYLDSYTMEYTGIGASYPQAHERLINKWNEGTALINYIGHANSKSWGHEYLLTWPNILAMSNERLPYIFAATCEFMRWDEDDISAGEVLWSLPNSGVIGMICPSREVLISANGVLNKATSKYFTSMDENGKPLAVGEIMIRGKNESNTGTNKLRYGLIGDPSIPLPWASNTVVVDKINGIDLENTDEYPVLSARSTVEVTGHIEDTEDNLIQDFNGIVEITLYDAEKVVTTNANGSDGVESVYNDRKTRLFVGRVKVTDGKWTAKFTMPSEIENNYSPALFSLYAYDETGRQANGSTEKLYAYGYDQTATEDYEGPKIIEFYLDHPGFVSGSQVSPNPTMKAVFSDASGISVSEAGIGHNITLELDGKIFFDDISQYYIPDETDSGKGSVTYALTGISQGDHTIKFTVWDNANNSTTASLDFCISALWKPSIETLTTDVNPATANVNFIVGTDGSTGSMECTIDVYDIWGRNVWRGEAPSFSGSIQRTTLGWNLCDFSGARIPGGIYLYKATVKTDTGATVTKTKKLFVTGQ